jgi:hypothetical protein
MFRITANKVEMIKEGGVFEKEKQYDLNIYTGPEMSGKNVCPCFGPESHGNGERSIDLEAYPGGGDCVNHFEVKDTQLMVRVSSTKDHIDVVDDVDLDLSQYKATKQEVEIAGKNGTIKYYFVIEEITEEESAAYARAQAELAKVCKKLETKAAIDACIAEASAADKLAVIEFTKVPYLINSKFKDEVASEVRNWATCCIVYVTGESDGTVINELVDPWDIDTGMGPNDLPCFLFFKGGQEIHRMKSVDNPDDIEKIQKAIYERMQ